MDIQGGEFFQLVVLPFSWIYKGASFFPIGHTDLSLFTQAPTRRIQPLRNIHICSLQRGGVGGLARACPDLPKPCPDLPGVVYRESAGSPFLVEPRAMRVARPKTVFDWIPIYYYSAITIRLAKNELNGSDELMLTKGQINKIKRAMENETGVDIKISKTQ